MFGMFTPPDWPRDLTHSVGTTALGPLGLSKIQGSFRRAGAPTNVQPNPMELTCPVDLERYDTPKFSRSMGRLFCYLHITFCS